MDYTSLHDFINRHEWTFAKTYAAFCPHEYIVMKKQPEEEWPLFPEFAQFIRENGFVAEYGRLGPNRYLVVDDYYYWTLDKNVEDTDLINRAKLSDFHFIHKMREGKGVVICRRNKGSRTKEMDIDRLIVKVNEQTEAMGYCEDVAFIKDAGDCYYVVSYHCGIEPPYHPPYVVDENGNIEGTMADLFLGPAPDPRDNAKTLFENYGAILFQLRYGQISEEEASQRMQKAREIMIKVYGDTYGEREGLSDRL